MLQLVQIQSTNYILSETRQLPQATFSWLFQTAEGKMLSEMKGRGSLLSKPSPGIRSTLRSEELVPQRASPPWPRTLLEGLSEGTCLWGEDLCPSSIHSWHVSLRLPLTAWQ